MTSDEDLAAAWALGERPAFDELVRRYERRVYAICYRYFGNAADAEDAAQDAFIALLRRGSTYTGASSFSTWMYRVATNACNDLARKRARRPQAAADGMDRLVRTAAPDDHLANRELGIELAEALAQLDAEQREAVVLHDVVGLTHAEIAERQQVAVGTVKSRVHRAHGRLADLLVTAGREPPSVLRPPTEQT